MPGLSENKTDLPTCEGFEGGTLPLPYRKAEGADTTQVETLWSARTQEAVNQAISQEKAHTGAHSLRLTSQAAYTSKRIPVEAESAFTLSGFATVVPESEPSATTAKTSSSPATLSMPLFIPELPQPRGEVLASRARLRVNLLSAVPPLAALFQKAKTQPEQNVQKLNTPTGKVIIEVHYFDENDSLYKVEQVHTTKAALTSWEKLSLKITPPVRGSVAFSVFSERRFGETFLDDLCFTPQEVARVVQENH